MRQIPEDPSFQVARQRMVDEQLRARGIHDQRVLDAMSQVPRQEFVEPRFWNEVYGDHPVPVDAGQTISQPYMVALMLEFLRLRPDHTVLEFGTGTGYQAALLAELATQVISVELVDSLAERSRQNFVRLGIENVEVIVGDGSVGYPSRAPYDRIIVAAAAPSTPSALVDQLADGGLLLVPVGAGEAQDLQRIERVDGETRTESLGACRFVPLIGEQGHRP